MVSYFADCLAFLGTLNHACAQAPAPVQQKATKDNESIFDRKLHNKFMLLIIIWYYCANALGFII